FLAEERKIRGKQKGSENLLPKDRDSLSDRDPFAAHHEHMRQVMRSFSEPFGRDPLLRLPEGGAAAAGRAPEGRQDADFGDPFSAMDRMMSNMRNSMLEMHRKFDDLSLQPSGGHSFSSSSMMTYSKVGNEPPKVFQASAQTCTAPGGIKETRKALKDSESGVEKIAIGHHIQDRAHVVRKSRNARTGDEEMNQEFINLDESEADTFNEEWQKEIMKFRPCRSREAVENPRFGSIHYNPRESAIPAAEGKSSCGAMFQGELQVLFLLFP
uniref:Myeloid leukemia factor 1 n=1 Tax=Catharus ustulatus TaxID=91951 RepID=A0A8C3Y8L3_CATUS